MLEGAALPLLEGAALPLLKGAALPLLKGAALPLLKGAALLAGLSILERFAGPFRRSRVVDCSYSCTRCLLIL